MEYSDVARHWAKDAVNDMGSRLVIEGTDSGTFEPDKNITRAEFSAIAVRALGLKPENGTGTYTDVMASDWYNDVVNTAQVYHLINGYEDGAFRPGSKITREEAMMIIDRAMILTGLKKNIDQEANREILSRFKDSTEVSSWAEASVIDCLKAGIISGRSESTLAPKAYITRAETAVIMENLLQLSGLINNSTSTP
jgi:hypothetical protein